MCLWGFSRCLLGCSQRASGGRTLTGFLSSTLLPFFSRVTLIKRKIKDKGYPYYEGASQEPTHRPQSSSFLGLPYRNLNMNPKKELLWGLWVASI